MYSTEGGRIMPYIDKALRKGIDNRTAQVVTAGELNYKITQVLQEYLEVRGESYQTYNDMCGVLTCAQMELYRRKVVHYENKKIDCNGDVWL